ncbi:unnamed protein product [Coregonus sp. 'balchen']|nr:unnamed protein product [Coregonus sp. 'balchen']
MRTLTMCVSMLDLPSLAAAHAVFINIGEQQVDSYPDALCCAHGVGIQLAAARLNKGASRPDVKTPLPLSTPTHICTVPYYSAGGPWTRKLQQGRLTGLGVEVAQHSCRVRTRLGPLCSSTRHSTMPERVCGFQGQSFHKLKRVCLRRGKLFQDPLFPPSALSLFYKRDPPPGLTWKRPRELCKDPRLFVDGISTRDLHQGSLGNCWMVAATSCLASEPSLWKKVIPDHMEQEWNPKRPDLYAGIFHFRFWRLGRWTDVVVDDRLPVNEDGTLLFCRSATPREFWSALLEKAYAKLNGCYEALEGGNTAEALIDFTGGVSEPLSLDREALTLHLDQRRALFQTLAKAHGRRALITCSIRVRLGECSLLGGCGGRLCMVRMRNPWGTADWTGPWSQGSQHWQQVGRGEREKMGLIVRDVGEFWMEFEDFCRYFTDVVVCRLVERALLWPRTHWREVRCPGEWAPAPNTPGTLLSSRHAPNLGKNTAKPGGLNQTQRGDRKEARLGERQRGGGGGGRGVRDGGKEKMLVAKEREKKMKRKEEGVKKEGEVDGGWDEQTDKNSRCGGCINHKDTFLHNPQAASSVYMDSRSVALRVTLGPGRYALLPTTFQPGATGRFLIRLFSHSHLRLSIVTTVHLRRASGLSQPKQTAPDVYAVIWCEDDTIRTHVFKEDGNPEFNMRAIFYRRYPDAHISIEGGQSRSGSRGCIYVETSSSKCLTDL